MQKNRMPSRGRFFPLLVPRTVTTRPRIVTFTSAASTPGSSKRTRIFSPSSTMSTLGSQAEAGATTGLLLSTKREKSRLTSRWRRESSTIGPKNLNRRIAGSLRRLRVGPPEQVLELAEELVHVLEFPIHRSEPDVGDLVELPEVINDVCADVVRRHFSFLGVVEKGLDFIDDRVELRRSDGPLFAGLHEASAELLPIEILPPTVLLDDHVRDFLDRLIRRETAAARFAFPAAADHFSLAALARVHDAIVHRAAERTLHASIMARPAESSHARAQVPRACRLAPGSSRSALSRCD